MLIKDFSLATNYIMDFKKHGNKINNVVINEHGSTNWTGLTHDKNGKWVGIAPFDVDTYSKKGDVLPTRVQNNFLCNMSEIAKTMSNKGNFILNSYSSGSN